MLKEFMSCSVPKSSGESGLASAHSVEAELKYVAFMLRLLRTFVTAAFSTRDEEAYAAAALARRNSSSGPRSGSGKPGSLALAPTDLGAPTLEEGSSFKQLKALLQGPAGVAVVELVDYSALQR
jgi:hypothetical protein